MIDNTISKFKDDFPASDGQRLTFADYYGLVNVNAYKEIEERVEVTLQNLALDIDDLITDDTMSYVDDFSTERVRLMSEYFALKSKAVGRLEGVSGDAALGIWITMPLPQMNLTMSPLKMLARAALAAINSVSCSPGPARKDPWREF